MAENAATQPSPRILVTQMTRMGDVLQTSPLIRSLKQVHPNAHIAVMVRRMGKAIAECNPDVDEVIVYEEDDMFLDLRSEDADRFLRAYKTADAHVQRLREGRFDIAYNCTHSLASALLLKLAGIPRVVGAHLSEDYRYVFRGRGPNCFLTNVLNRDLNALNLCDMFRHFVEAPPKASGLVMTVDDTRRQEVASLLEGLGIARDAFLVCFQLGASDRDKRWPEAQFAALGLMLAQRRQARIALVGVADEAPLGQAFEEYAPGLAVHLFGKTSIPQLAALLERANLLVTNDTGTMHIAAAVGCPIVLTSVGYVHFRETGPYGAGHCAIERRRAHLGRSDVRHEQTGETKGLRAEQVLRAVDLVLENRGQDSPPLLDEAEDLSDVDLYWSRFASDQCLEWYPVIQRAMGETDALRMAYRAMWVEYLTGKSSKSTEDEDLRRMLGQYLPSAGESAEGARALTGLAELAQQGARMTEKLLDILTQGRSIKQAQQIVADLMRLDEEIRLYGEVHAACKPLVAIARFERDHLEGADPVLLSRTTLEIYRGMHARARLCERKLKRILELRRLNPS